MTSPKSHSYAGSWPFGCWYQTCVSVVSWRLANDRVDLRQRQAVEREIPRREPRVFPRVGHREDVRRVELAPVRVAARQPFGRGRWIGRVAVEPLADVEVVELLAPEQARERLPLDPPFLGGHLRAAEGRIERIGLCAARVEDRIRAGERVGRELPGQAQQDLLGRTRRNDEAVPERRLRAGPAGVDGVAVPVHDERVERVLHVRRGVRRGPESLGVRLVLGEQRPRLASCGQHVIPEPRVDRLDGSTTAGSGSGNRPAVAELRPVRLPAPCPGVPEPERRQEMERGRIRTVVRGGDPDQDVVGRDLRVLHVDVEEAVLGEDPRVAQLVLGIGPVAPPALRDQVVVRERALRVAIPAVHVRVRRRVVEVPVDLLDVLAVVALVAGQAEGALLEDRVPLVPEGNREAEPGVLVGDAEKSVLAPAVGARAGVVVGQVLPRRAASGVVLADRAPLAFREVRPPPIPVGGTLVGIAQPAAFGVEGIGHGGPDHGGAFVTGQ